VTAQLTSALVFARTAENPVGPVICTVPDGSDGLMLSDGPGFVGPHPQSDAPTATPAATIMKRIKTSQSQKTSEAVVSRRARAQSTAWCNAELLYQRSPCAVALGVGETHGSDRLAVMTQHDDATGPRGAAWRGAAGGSGQPPAPCARGIVGWFLRTKLTDPLDEGGSWR
jgi:hypothetical protein